MPPELLKGSEGKESPSQKGLDQAAKIANEKSKQVADALRADPKTGGVISGMWKGVKEGAISSWHGTTAVARGTGEFLGVGVAKLIHEGGESFLKHAEETLKPIGSMVNIAGEAIVITAFEAVHGDQSVVLGAVEYWKEKGVVFGKLPAEKQAELLASFATQVTLGIVGTKGLGALSNTATASRIINTGVATEKIITGTAKVGVMSTGLDSSGIRSKIGVDKRITSPSVENITKAEVRSSVSRETVLKNARLPDTERLLEAEKILREKGLLQSGESLSEFTKAEIIASHNAGKGVYENTVGSLKTKVDAGKDAVEKLGGTKVDMLTAEKRRVLMEHGITGQLKFDETFFSQIDNVSNDINKKGGIQTYLDGFAGKELSLEQLVIIIKDNPTIFKNPKELTDFLKAYDIKAPSAELINTALKGFHELNVKELLKVPKNINISDITNISNSLDSAGFDAIIKKFFQDGNPVEINNFIKNFNETKLGFNFDISKLSNESLKAILESPSIDKTDLGRFISYNITSTLPIEKAKLIQTFLSSEKCKGIFTDKLLDDHGARLNTIIDKMAPQNIVDGFLKGHEIELYSGELAKNGSSARGVWNLHFDKNYDSRFEMIFRGKPEFFFENNLDRFFNSSFFELTIKNKSSLYDLIKEGGTYYEKIKGYRNYNEILETAKTANNKIAREGK